MYNVILSAEFSIILVMNKKVLLRERKRHTDRRVASTPSVVLPRYPPRLDLAGGGVPCQGGTPWTWPRTPPPPGPGRTNWKYYLLSYYVRGR